MTIDQNIFSKPKILRLNIWQQLNADKIMKIQTVNTPIVIKPFSKHEIMKNSILEDINFSMAENVKTRQGSDITRCDWSCVNLRREWVNNLMPLLEPEVLEIYKNLGYDWIKIYNIWFQQYGEKSVHNWHVHTECQWTNVYYLQLPENCPKTEILDPISKKIVVLDVNEGDICCFPSYLIHRAPCNKSKETKTIISWNSGSYLN
jgi:hypothetical protein